MNLHYLLKVPYSNYTEAFKAFENTEIYGVIHFGKSFSDDLKLRETNGAETAIETILGSDINVQLDWTSEYSYKYFQTDIYLYT